MLILQHNHFNIAFKSAKLAHFVFNVYISIYFFMYKSIFLRFTQPFVASRGPPCLQGSRVVEIRQLWQCPLLSLYFTEVKMHKLKYIHFLKLSKSVYSP